MLDIGGLAGLALVYHAVGEGVLSRRPGLVSELEQDRPCDDAVVMVAEHLLQFFCLCGLAAGCAAERGRRCFGGIPCPFGGFARLMYRRVLVLGTGHGGQGVVQPACRAPDRPGEHLARFALAAGERRAGQERSEVIEQMKVALPVERL